MKENNNQTTRRTFIRLLSLGTAGIYLSGCTGASDNELKKKRPSLR